MIPTERGQAMRAIQDGYQLIHRLERLSADSTVAHLSSGIRGSLLRAIEQLEIALAHDWNPPVDLQPFGDLTRKGYLLLEKGARDVVESNGLAARLRNPTPLPDYPQTLQEEKSF